MFDGLVLEISFVDFNETLHATLYGYELVFILSGVSVVTLSAENREAESIFFGPENDETTRAVKSSEDDSGHVCGSSGIFWSVFESSWMMCEDFEMHDFS